MEEETLIQECSFLTASNEGYEVDPYNPEFITP